MASEWQYLPFDEAVEINPLVSLKLGHIYPFVDMQAVEPRSRTVRPSDYREFKGSGSRFTDGDTLMARITPCLENGKIARFHSDGQHRVGFGSTEFIVIRGRAGVTENDFAYYLTCWDYVRQYAISQMTGTSGRQRVPISALSHLEVPVPPLLEQRAIAHVLGTLDDKIELLRRMNETLEAMARALFKSWFVDFDPVIDNALEAGNPIPDQLKEKAKRRLGLGNKRKPLPKHIRRLFPDRFVDSELGPIPHGWQVGTLGKEFNLIMGQSPPGSTYSESRVGLPFYQGRRDFGFRFPSPRVYCSAPTRIASPGDTLVTVRAPVGDINMANEKCCIGRGVAAIRHKTKAVSYTYYTMHNLAAQFRQHEAKGTVFGSMTKRDFEAIKILVPNPVLVQVFERTATPLDEAIKSLSQQISTLAALRDALLPKLISGELRVKDTEQFLKERGLWTQL